MIVKLAEGYLQTRFGTYQEFLFYNGLKETVVMVLGDVRGRENVLCRIHSSCLHGHYFNSTECDCREQMDESQMAIFTAGAGIIVLLDQEGKGNGHYGLMKSKEFMRNGMDQGKAYEAAGFTRDARDFSVVAEILESLAVKSVRLLPTNSGKAEALKRLGITVIKGS